MAESEIPTEMLVRVAKALAYLADDDYDIHAGFWRDYAETAIEAMREPTKAMILAGVHHDNMGDMEGRWKAMIDVALCRQDNPNET